MTRRHARIGFGRGPSTTLAMMLALAPGAGAAAPADLPATAVARGWAEMPHTGPAIRVLEIAGVAVQMGYPVLLDSARPVGGTRVKIARWPPAPAAQVWVRVSDVDVDVHACYGPARWNGVDESIIDDVQLRGGQHARGEISVQAFASASGAEDQPCEARWAAATDVSAPVRVLVERASVLETDGRIRIAALDGRMVLPDEPVVTASHADIEGTIAGSGGLVYLLVGAPGAATWEVLGPAEVQGSAWTIRNAWFHTDRGVTGQRRTLVAALFRSPLGGRRLSHLAWREQAVVASPTVTAILQPFGDDSRLTIEALGLPGTDQALELEGRSSVELERLDQLSGVSGRLVGEARAPIWVVTRSDGAAVARIHGPAELRDGRWFVEGSTLREPGHLEGAAVRMYAISSSAVAGEGLTFESTVRERAEVVSAEVTVRLATAVKRRDRPVITIARAGGTPVTADNTAAMPRSDLEGTISEAAPELHLQLRAAVRAPGGSSWLLSPPATLNEDRWTILHVPALDQLSPEDRRELIVLATAYPLAGDTLTADELARLPLAVSPLLQLGRPGPVTGGRSTSGGASEAPSWILPLLLTFLLIALAAAMLVLALRTLERRSPVLSTTLQHLSQKFAAVAERVARTTEPLVRPGEDSLFFGKSALIDQFLGVTILAALALVISFYIPLYQKVIGSVLGVSKQTSHSLAVALITFAALSGLLLEISAKLIWPSRTAPLFGRLLQGVMALSVGALMLACTGALCVVNTLVYASFYERQAPAVSMAFAGAALLMSITEVVGFFVGMRLGFGRLVWLMMNALGRLPLAIAVAALDLAYVVAHVGSQGPTGEQTARPPHSHHPVPVVGAASARVHASPVPGATLPVASWQANPNEERS